MANPQLLALLAKAVEMAKDEHAPLGACDRCRAPYELDERGRIAAHICRDLHAPVSGGGATVLELRVPERVAVDWMSDRD
ncbi:MAG: hypothetical protein H0W63_04060 [Gemmatimonadaceae bacterium]|nr:hypothetical protein [Gemmatimonadaceae bacterium]